HRAAAGSLWQHRGCRDRRRGRGERAAGERGVIPHVLQAWLDLARQNAPYLMLVAPLASAALALMTPGPRSAGAIACMGAFLATLLGGDLAYRVLALGAPLNFAVIGLALNVDGVSVFAAPLLASLGALVMIAGAAGDDGAPRATPFRFSLALIMLAG